MNKASIPTRSAWQSAIDESGFELKLNPNLMPFQSEGLLPGKLMGREASFEIYYKDIAEVPDDVQKSVQGNDSCITLRWSSSMIDSAAAMIASYALAKSFGAIVSYHGEAPRDLEAFFNETQDVLEFAKVEF